MDPISNKEDNIWIDWWALLLYIKYQPLNYNAGTYAHKYYHREYYR